MRGHPPPGRLAPAGRDHLVPGALEEHAERGGHPSSPDERHGGRVGRSPAGIDCSGSFAGFPDEAEYMPA
jgi:hypothetical protein